MKTKIALLLSIILVIMLSTACQFSFPGSGLEETIAEVKPGSELTPSATPTGLSLSADVITETPAPPLPKGYFELHVRVAVQDEQECVVKYPFTARIEDGRMLIQGEDNVELDCRFKGEFCEGDGCLNIHLEYLMDTRVDGEILGFSSEPSPSLHAFYFYDGEMIVYYTGLPPQAPNPWPPENPMTVSSGDIATLVLAFEDGASATFPVGISIDQQIEIDPPIWELILKLE